MWSVVSSFSDGKVVSYETIVTCRLPVHPALLFRFVHAAKIPYLQPFAFVQWPRGSAIVTLYGKQMVLAVSPPAAVLYILAKRPCSLPLCVLLFRHLHFTKWSLMWAATLTRDTKRQLVGVGGVQGTSECNGTFSTHQGSI